MFETWRKRLGAILAPAAFFLTWFFCDGLSPEGRNLAAIVVAVSLLWMSEVIPLAATALLGAVLCVILGVADARTVLAHFADPIVFVFIGGFVIARAMTIHGLDRRIALGFLSIRWVGSRPATVMAGVGLVSAAISMWVSNSATTAMMLPIALGILGAMDRGREPDATADMGGRPFATGIMLMVAFGASIGGIGTPVGSPPNLIGIGMIRQHIGVSIGFLQWMALAIPIFLVMGVALFSLLWLLHREDDPPAAESREQGNANNRDDDRGGARSRLLNHVRRERHRLGPWTRGQVNTLIAFSVAVTLWVVPGILQTPWFEGQWLGAWTGKHLPESIVAIGSAILLFMLPVDLSERRFTLAWRDAERIDWGTIFLFGGGLALGSLMFSTGVAHAMGDALAGLLGLRSLWALTGLSIALAILMSEAASNTASANMIIPVVIAIAQAAGVSPLPPALGACLGASFGFMLPVSTPPNAIVYGSGLIPLPKMMRAGILFDILGFFIIWGGLYVLCPLLGLT